MKQIKLKSFSRIYTMEDLHPHIKEKYITKDGYLKVKLGDSIYSINDLIIKLKYFEIIDYIHKIGKGKMFLQQLIDYIVISKNVSKSRAQHIIDELYYYKLINKKNAWNNKLVILSTQSFKFYGEDKCPNKYSIGFITKQTFFVEYYLRYQMLNNFSNEEKILTLISEEHIKKLHFQKHMYVENIVTSNDGHHHITFAYLNYLKGTDASTLENKVKYINSILPMTQNITFGIRVCNYDNATNTLLKRRWQTHSFRVLSTYYRFKGFQFTSLNIKRYFTVSFDKYEDTTND